MNILIVGGGGREHAFAWKVVQSDRVETVFVAPGNAGTQVEPGVENVPIGVEDIDALVEFALKHQVGLTIVGPEAPLVLGIVDRFNERGLRCFGPSKAAAQLEGSKAFTKDFLARHKIPTAAYATFTDVDKACAYVELQGMPIVIKADGLAAGKGVIIAETFDQAQRAIKEMLVEARFGSAGDTVVIESFLKGEEASFICMVDGQNILPLATSQDHKARDDGDTGPNTGGMGAYSPAPVVTEEMHQRIMREVIVPTVRGLQADQTPYLGFLYAGLMISEQGVPEVLEYNCRFGDPETQPILFRLQSDLVELCEAALDGNLDKIDCAWDGRCSLGVVMAAGGYPENYRKGDVISGLKEAESANVKVFHAGTKIQDGQVTTSGGRVLCVTALGDSVTQAQKYAYQAAQKISWDGAFYRTDIGYRAIARENS